MVNRTCKPLLKRSIFFLGARGPGKSTLINELFKKKKVLNVDLLDPELVEEFSLKPFRFNDQVLATKRDVDWVVVDIVQNVPKLHYVYLVLIFTHKMSTR